MNTVEVSGISNVRDISRKSTLQKKKRHNDTDSADSEFMFAELKLSNSNEVDTSMINAAHGFNSKVDDLL